MKKKYLFSFLLVILFVSPQLKANSSVISQTPINFFENQKKKVCTEWFDLKLESGEMCSNNINPSNTANSQCSLYEKCIDSGVSDSDFKNLAKIKKNSCDTKTDFDGWGNYDNFTSPLIEGTYKPCLRFLKIVDLLVDVKNSIKSEPGNSDSSNFDLFEIAKEKICEELNYLEKPEKGTASNDTTPIDRCKSTSFENVSTLAEIYIQDNFEKCMRGGNYTCQQQKDALIVYLQEMLDLLIANAEDSTSKDDAVSSPASGAVQ